eukprot:CAMPEP_0177394982 /NCGR_PEP_ID=MMETSP0368-20130122/55864_1 /TAXON_ID=447022 ORGANISM="Scrippsiella hangoei-like, Strain SHHI-4" /NCGR_SAMPLE_ID=MMETSP0368 /ASSEMBLY_ACC=CAM_ASM_000363 /LENGTH=61 /DNA_ID=CAMNT_0018861447 /DNA_START=323 /DNA_END=509 /DNA_ORIENTATION=-
MTPASEQTAAHRQHSPALWHQRCSVRHEAEDRHEAVAVTEAHAREDEVHSSPLKRDRRDVG